MRRSLRATVLWLVCQLVVGPAVVRAQPAAPRPRPQSRAEAGDLTLSLQRAKQAYTSALGHMARGQFERAAPLFELVHDATGVKNALWNLAECYRLLGRPGASIASLDRYLNHPRITAAERAQAQATIAKLRSQTAQLRIDSNLAGATITVDGRLAGLTPLLAYLDPGRHAIEVTSAGFAKQAQQLVLVAGQDRQLKFSLTTLPGKVEVRTRPPGAAIFIGGQQVGISPLSTSAPAGTIDVLARLPGHRDALRPVQLPPGEVVRLQIPLEARSAELSIASQPGRAQVSLAKRPVGEAPLAALKVPPGEQALTVSRPGYYPWSGTVRVTDGDRARVDVTLRRGRLHVAWFAGTLALAAAAAVAGGVVLSRAQVEADGYNAGLSSLSRLAGSPMTLDRMRAQVLEQGRLSDRYFTTSLALFGTAGGLALASGVLAFFTHWRPSEGTIRITPGAGTLSLGGRF